MQRAPGTEDPRRLRPSLRYELIGCSLHGHELLGTDARRLRQTDALFAREAEYLTFAETGLLVPFEIYELTKTVSYLKILTLVINLAVVVYLLLRHRLFGLRGGATAERSERERDSGWAALERATPAGLLVPSSGRGVSAGATGSPAGASR